MIILPKKVLYIPRWIILLIPPNNKCESLVDNKPQGFLEVLFAEIVVINFLGVLGIGFSILLKVVSSENIFFKGWLYGTFMWFAIYAAMTMYRLNHIYPVDTNMAFFSLIAASIWSIGMTRTLLFLNQKYGVEN